MFFGLYMLEASTCGAGATPCLPSCGHEGRLGLVGTTGLVKPVMGSGATLVGGLSPLQSSLNVHSPPPIFLDSPLCLCPGSYQLASAGRRHQSAHQRLPLLGQADPSLGPASWLLPSQCSRWQVGEKAPLPGLQKGLGLAVEPSVPRRFQEQLFQASPLGPRCAQAGQGPWLSGGHVAMIVGAPCSALHLLMGQPLLPALIPCSSKKQTSGAASSFARNISTPA